MSLQEQVDKIWDCYAESKAAEWAKQLKEVKKRNYDATKMFHEWQPLLIYTSYTRAINSGLSFSLRYFGQEVAILSFGGDVVYLDSRKSSKNNLKYFGISLHGKFEWQGPEAKKFRQDFKKLPDSYREKVRVIEHRYESEFLQQMSSSSSSKFNGTLRDIQPVMYAGCPFQFPLPISGNTGTPVLKNGNIDILARRGTGRGTKISIWELKRPKVTAHAIEQVYIYALTLLKMLRNQDAGKIWYKDVIGFGSDVPEKLTIECVIAVSDISSSKLEDKLRSFIKENPLDSGDKINFFIAYYKNNPLTVELKPID